jgi:hypothetical protein
LGNVQLGKSARVLPFDPIRTTSLDGTSLNGVEGLDDGVEEEGTQELFAALVDDAHLGLLSWVVLLRPADDGGAMHADAPRDLSVADAFEVHPDGGRLLLNGGRLSFGHG